MIRRLLLLLVVFVGLFSTQQSFAQCTGPLTVTVQGSSSGQSLGGSISGQTNVLCFGQSTGSVTVAGSGGSSPYQYQINGGTLQTSGTFPNLAAGSYTVTVKDVNACTYDVAVTIIEPAASVSISSASVTSNYNGSQLSCNGASDGIITVVGAGGVAPYQYSKDGGTTFQGTGVFSGLAAGTYNIVVKDANLCTATTTVTITAPAAIGVTASVTSNYNGSQLSCNGASDGQVTAVGSGGTGSYQYSIDGGAYQGSGVFTGLAAGSHTVSIKDANNCTTTTTVTITAPAAIGVTASVTSNYNGSQLSCNGASDGQVTAVGSGGTGSYQYSIDGGTYQGSGVFTGLAAGSHTVSIKDANNCTTTTSVTITAPAAIGVTASVTSNYNGSQLSCNGSSDGQVTAVGSGGTGSYQYSIDGGAYQGSGVFTGLAAGSHTVSIKDANNCTTTTSVTITAPAAITASSAVTSNYSGSQISCPTSTDGEITVTASGGTGTLQYSINGGSTYQSSHIFTGLGAGSYTITVKDANNCTTTTTVTITAPAGVTIASASVTSNFNGFGVSCATGQGTSNNGQVTVTASGGSGTLQYSKDGGTTFQTSNIFNALTAGIYSIVVKDANGCTATASVTVTAPTAITAGTCTPAQDLCQLSLGQIKVEAANGVAPYTVAWTGNNTTSGSGNIATSGGSVTFTGMIGNVTYQFIVTDTNGCHIQ